MSTESANIDIGTPGNYDYGKVIHASLLFYEAQRSGKLPADNRIPWRGDSMLDDKGDNGEDLTGGYFDAGDLVKFGLPMAYTMTTLSWGILLYEDAYTKAGELENARKAIKWGTDYLLKAHTKEQELYGQVGNGEEDHAYWGRPEDWPKDKKRPAYKITAEKPGSELAGETSAAMTAASLVFKKVDPTYSEKLLTHAKQLYKFANEKRGLYTDSITDAQHFYTSTKYGDELGWAAAWLLKATNESHYKADVEKHYKEFDLTKNSAFGWGEKSAGTHVLMAQMTGEAIYKSALESFCHWVTVDAKKTPKGLSFISKWGSLRLVSDAAFICLQAADLGINAADYRAFANKSIGYALGDTGRSFVVGVGVNPPAHEHHRASSCPDRPKVCDHSAFTSPTPNPQVLTGALVGGPDADDSYEDKRDDYVHNEVACDYNAGFQSASAGLLHLKLKGLL
jgi:endoglucanase